MAREETRISLASTGKRRRTAESGPLAIEGDHHAAAEASGGSGCSASSPSSTCCGICLSSAGERAVRGIIDCCDHYFCFTCIREWGKVESRCPMCKRRFRSIRRPAVEGLFTTERVVDVPLRDQVYDPLGIRTFDPYAESRCSVCNGSEDEWLLLLCDLCDVASHTYCVGLGFTVPTGDWFCPDCTVIRESQADEEESGEGRSSLLLSIVREGSCSEINGPVEWVSQPSVPSSSASNKEGPSPVHECKDPIPPIFGARTRHQCRDVHNHIRALRENWEALRHGSVSFSSGPIIDRKNSREQHQMLPEENGGSGKASSLGFQPADRGGETPASSSRGKVPDDVNKAWKMMDLAKSRQRGRSSTTTTDGRHAAKNRVKKENASERVNSVYSNLSYLGGCSGAGKQKREPWSFKSGIHSAEGGAAKSSPAGLSFPYSRANSVSSGKAAGASRDTELGATLHVSYSQDKCSRMVCSGNPGEESSRAASVKSEIQSLVKQNLKQLTSGKRLEVDVFKEIARASTHNVLAACGLEHSKSIQCCSFTSPRCPHLDQGKLQDKASPAPNSCRDCFNAFVKDVVSSIMRDKVGRAR